MEVRTYRARSLQEALRWIRNDLGPDAAVLHTREVSAGILGWFQGRQLEVTAGVGVAVPSRFESPATGAADAHEDATEDPDNLESPEYWHEGVPPADQHDFRRQYRHDLGQQNSDLPSLVEQLSRRSADPMTDATPTGALSQLITSLLEVDMDEGTARQLADRVRSRSSAAECNDLSVLMARLARLIEDSIACSGPIQLTPNKQKIVALVGPTGVGKTTTIAKLAGNFYLQEQRRVGLVTLDTYRVAAVDQLRTYAEIIDLPMEVVTTPREVRRALAKLAECELLLVDSSGLSPCDDTRLRELKAMLDVVQADDVQLVLSSVASVSSLKQSMARFATLGATGLILTKLDETTVLGHLMSFLGACRLPISYVTYGQNVPDDMAAANAQTLAQQILGLDGGR